MISTGNENNILPGTGDGTVHIPLVLGMKHSTFYCYGGEIEHILSVWGMHTPLTWGMALFTFHG
jgi:hypothetical protein